MIVDKTNNQERIKLTANILFSGIGAQERGFRDSGLFDVDVLTTSEISKEAVLSYAAIHCGLTPDLINSYNKYPSRKEMADYLTKINLGYDPDKDKKYDWYRLVKRKNRDIEKYWLACKLSNNVGDISLIEELPYADLWFCSFPCQSISVAGKMKGFKPDSGTRSSLLWDNIKLLKKAKDNDTLPKYIMFENVKNLVSKMFIDDFNDLLDVMSELKFNSYWQVLNAKECGIPQNRERVFVVSIRKDIDTHQFTFPVPFDNGLRLRDILEDNPSEKYYMSNEKTQKLLNTLLSNNIISPERERERDVELALTEQSTVRKKEKSQTVSPQGKTEESQISNKQVSVLLSNKGEKFEKQIDVASTLLARDYKGFGNQAMNGVIEWE